MKKGVFFSLKSHLTKSIQKPKIDPGFYTEIRKNHKIKISLILNTNASMFIILDYYYEITQKLKHKLGKPKRKRKGPTEKWRKNSAFWLVVVGEASIYMNCCLPSICQVRMNLPKLITSSSSCNYFNKLSNKHPQRNHSYIL